MKPIALLVALSLATAAFLCAYVIMGAAPTRVAEMLVSTGWTVMLALWVDADARRRRRVPCFEVGFLVAAFLPVSLVCYCVWSRGWRRGLLVLLALLGLWAVPQLVAMYLRLVL
jgi:hypothetical protein